MRHTNTKDRRRHGRAVRRYRSGRMANPRKSRNKVTRARLRASRRSKRR